MSEKTNCPYCGKTNVKGRLDKSAVMNMAFLGGAAGLYLGPLGPLVGAPIGAGVGKVIDMMRPNKSYKFKCPRCGETWYEDY